MSAGWARSRWPRCTGSRRCCGCPPMPPRGRPWPSGSSIAPRSRRCSTGSRWRPPTRSTSRWCGPETAPAAPAAWLAANTATTRVAAHVRLKTSRLAAGMTHVNAAARRGELGADTVHHLARARTPETADAFDTDEAWLVARLTPLRAEAARAELASWRLGVLERDRPQRARRPRPHPGQRPRPARPRRRLRRPRAAHRRPHPDRAGHRLRRHRSRDRPLAPRRARCTDDTRTRSELHGAAFLDVFRRGLTRTDQHGAPRPLVLAIVDTDTLAGRHHRPRPTARQATGSSSPRAPGPKPMHGRQGALRRAPTPTR